MRMIEVLPRDLVITTPCLFDLKDQFVMLRIDLVGIDSMYENPIIKIGFAWWSTCGSVFNASRAARMAFALRSNEF